MTTARVEPPTTAGPARRPELDAIRALVVVGLVFFHTALVFDASDDYYVKNAETTHATMIATGLGVVWAMPMLFLIAGLGSWHSLRRRGAAGFAAERLRRLGVPLVFATLTIIPVPQWLRLRADPGYHESYLRFLPRFFQVRLDPTELPFVLQGRYFEVGHLWFVVLLLAFSLLLAPLVRWSPHDLAGRIRDRTARAVGRRGVVLLAAVPVAVVSALLGLEQAYAAWSRWAYLLFFLYGFVLAADERFRAAMRRDARLAAALGVVLFLAGLPVFLTAGDATGGNPLTDMNALAIGARAVYGATGWCWLVAILGLLDRRRPAPAAVQAPRESLGRRLYGYLATAVLPLYILHQPILVAVAYGVVGLPAPIAVKYAVIVVATLGLTLAAYDLLVRRTRVTRFLFGMRAQA
ncbi:acyltransferase family protein [Sphaerisporangium viridialbum]|uniref:acyltransferase family protein n=1 Tax=Sphaerisporangium viridialbum TaxID=46189 RepID=UPI003C71FAC4